MEWTLDKIKVAILCHFKNAVCAHGLLWVSEPRALAATGGAPGWHSPAPRCVSQGRLLFLTPSDQLGKGPHESLPPPTPGPPPPPRLLQRGWGSSPTYTGQWNTLSSDEYHCSIEASLSFSLSLLSYFLI